MNEEFPVVVQKTLPVCLDRAWHLLASEEGLKKLTSFTSEGGESIAPLSASIAQIADKKRLSHISFWVSGPSSDRYLVRIKFIPRLRRTTVQLTQAQVDSIQLQEIFTDFWQKRMEEVV